jgi:hypothetical protein
LVDFAHHMIRMERMLKDAHDRCLEKKYDEAADIILELTSESRLLNITLREMHNAEKR